MIPQKITDDLNNIATQVGEWQDKQTAIPGLQADVTAKQQDLTTSETALQAAQQDSAKEAGDIANAIAQLQADIAAINNDGTPPDTVPSGSGGTPPAPEPRGSARHQVGRR